MSLNSIGDALKAKSREISPAISEVGIFKHLIRERVHPLDLVRELLSNAGAQQVEATRIEISYTQDKDGHIFEISDNGCGMNYTGDAGMPGRLDKFMGLGLSGIIGLQSDEFSWKGLIFERIESSDAYLAFRRLPELEKVEKQGEVLAEEKRAIERPEQTWVVLEKGGGQPTVLLREPQNESEVNALIWKLEALGALPFETFRTLAYVGAFKGPDLLVHFQEDKSSEPFRATIVEVENNFYNYKTHGHTPSQYPKVVCWDIPASGRKAKINKTQKPYKFTQSTDEYQVHVFALKYMDGIKVMSREDLQKKGISI